MDRRAVIVGGGVIGASIAWHMMRDGWKDVVILDGASGPGQGSTGKATGGYRASFGTAPNIHLSLLAREQFDRFNDETGGDAGFNAVGYLWLASTDDELEDLRRGLALQREEGVPDVHEVTPDDIARLNPAVDVSTLVGGVYSPRDAYVRPLAILAGYLSAAGKLGANIRFDNRVTGFTRRGDRIAEVITDEGAIGCDVVINAAGSWAGSVARMAQVELPVTPLRRQIVPTVSTEALPRTMPMTLWAGDGFHFRVRDDHVLIARPTPGNAEDPWDTRVEAAWVSDVEWMARERIPGLASVALDQERAWGGLYEMSPDKHPIIGFARECPNFMLANGSSGHGVMHSPAIGQLVSEILTDGSARSLDVGVFRPGRFDEGAAIAGGGLL